MADGNRRLLKLPDRHSTPPLGANRSAHLAIHWAGVQSIDRQVSHMAKLLDDLLDVAGITHGKMTIQPRIGPLSEVIDSAVETVRSVLQDRNHDFSVHLPSAGGSCGRREDAVTEVEPG